MAVSVPARLPTMMMQVQAVAAHDVQARLGEIAAPTLVIHGTEDQMLPFANGELIASKIPGARLAAGLVTQALTILFCIAVTVWGFRAAAREWDLPTMAMEIPTGLILGIVPVTMALCALRTVVAMAEDVAAWRRGEVLTHVAGRDF